MIAARKVPPLVGVPAAGAAVGCTAEVAPGLPAAAVAPPAGAVVGWAIGAQAAKAAAPEVRAARWMKCRRENRFLSLCAGIVHLFFIPLMALSATDISLST